MSLFETRFARVIPCRQRRTFLAGALVILSVLLPVVSGSCSFFADKMAATVARLYAGDAEGQAIIVEQDGYVVTNARTVRAKQSISVVLSDGKRYDARLLCFNPGRDAAILRIQGDYPALHPALWGDSDLVGENDEVSCVGFPAGGNKAVTARGAVVSLPKAAGISYLQTNVALGPGSAGSAMFNKSGEVIGMVTYNADQAGREGYALSSNEIQSLVAQAKEAEANPLTIDSVQEPSLAADGAVISWKTNRPSSTQVQFGLKADTYAFGTEEDTALLTDHGAVVKGLQPDTTYHYRVRSVDGCGNETVSEDRTLATGGPGTAAGKLTITNVNIYDLASSAVSVSWITNKPATGEVGYSPDKSGKQEVLAESTPVYEHKVRISGLAPETRYFISLKSSAKDEVAQMEAPSVKTPSSAPVCCKVYCRVPDFDFKTMQDTDFTNVDISGKETIIVFVNLQCSICMQQAIYLNDFYKAHPNSDIAMLLVGSSEKKADALDWTKKYGIVVPVMLDPTGNLVNTCKLRTIPSWLILDSGSIIKYYKSGGFGSRQEMEDALSKNL